jgi:hypothetical protein
MKKVIDMINMIILYRDVSFVNLDKCLYNGLFKKRSVKRSDMYEFLEYIRIV